MVLLLNQHEPYLFFASLLGESIRLDKFGSCFIWYQIDDTMKYLLFLQGSVVFTTVFIPLPYQSGALTFLPGFVIPDVIRPTLIPAVSIIWSYLLGSVAFILLILSSLLFREILCQRKRIADYRHCSREQLRFIRSLLDLCYAYRESPAVFLDKFKDKVNVRELKSYDLIDTSNKHFSNLKEDEKLLCLLWEHGFTQRELCVIFNLKKTSNLHIKHHRIRKKLEQN